MLKADQLTLVRIQSRIAAVIGETRREHAQQDRLLVGSDSKKRDVLSIEQSRVLEIVAKIQGFGLGEFPLSLHISCESFNTVPGPRVRWRCPAAHQPHL